MVINLSDWMLLYDPSGLKLNNSTHRVHLCVL